MNSTEKLDILNLILIEKVKRITEPKLRDEILKKINDNGYLDGIDRIIRYNLYDVLLEGLLHYNICNHILVYYNSNANPTHSKLKLYNVFFKNNFNTNKYIKNLFLNILNNFIIKDFQKNLKLFLLLDSYFKNKSNHTIEIKKEFSNYLLSDVYGHYFKDFLGYNSDSGDVKSSNKEINDFLRDIEKTITEYFKKSVSSKVISINDLFFPIFLENKKDLFLDEFYINFNNNIKMLGKDYKKTKAFRQFKEELINSLEELLLIGSYVSKEDSDFYIEKEETIW